MSSPERPTRPERAEIRRPKRESSRPLVCDGVVLRTPLLPIETLIDWTRDTIATAAWTREEDLSQAIEGDRLLLRARLRALLERPEIREAIYLAAPAVADGIDEWIADPESKRGRDLEHSLTRYVLRMSSRATPFGLFSGCSVGEVGASTRAVLGPVSGCHRHLEIDGDAVVAMADRIAASDDTWRAARLFTNTTVSETGHSYHYAEWRSGPAGRSYDLTRVSASPPVRLVIERAREGATCDELIAALVGEYGDVTPEDALAFVTELVAQHLLTSELEPAITGASPTAAFAAVLDRVDPARASTLTSVRERLAAIAVRPPGVAPSEYAATRELLRPLLPDDHRHWLHCALVKPADELTLGAPTLARLDDALSALERFAIVRAPLSDFIQRFRRRYEERFVPLAEVVDPELGIGFGSSGRESSPLLDGMPLGHFVATGATLRPHERRLAALLLRSDRDARAELVLDDAALSDLLGDAAPSSTAPSPWAFSAMFALGRRDEEQEPEVVLQLVMGPSGANLLGRFCHADPRIEAMVRNHLAGEQADAGVCFAEIVHAPEGRHVNVIARPVLRDYEIPYLGRSGAPRAQQIDTDDLLVGVHDNRVVLYSRRLEREIVPRLTSAHNVTGSSLPMYRFLAAVAEQDLPVHLAWTWGSALPEMFEFLPRVRLAGVIVALARWSCRERDATDLQAGDAAERFAAAQRLRQRLGLPRWVSHGFGDRLVLVDLDNSLAVDALAHAVRDGRAFELHEVHPAPDHQYVRGPEGRFVGEVVAPLRRSGTRRPALTAPMARIEAPARSFPPGSEWMYVRLFAGPSGVDHVLQETIAPIMQASAREGAIDRWFFVRYDDPDWHVRVRAHGDPAYLQRELLPRLLAATRATPAGGACWKTEVGTYERELERYGGLSGIELAERIFHLDSIHALACMPTLFGDRHVRWRAVLVGIDTTMRALMPDLAERYELMASLTSGMAREFALADRTEDELGKRYRGLRAEIDALVGGALVSLGDGFERATTELSAALVRCREALDELITSGRLHTPRGTFVGSVVHMHANRRLRADARAQEYVIYDYLRRSYRSMLGRARQRVREASTRP